MRYNTRPTDNIWIAKWRFDMATGASVVSLHKRPVMRSFDVSFIIHSCRWVFVSWYLFYYAHLQFSLLCMVLVFRYILVAICSVLQPCHCCFSTLRPRQNGRHFADDIFKCFFLNENVWIPIKTSLKFVPKGPINNIPALVQIMAWRRPGDKPLSEPMMFRLPTHICVTRPQWVK